jgi:hypothetical protein
VSVRWIQQGQALLVSTNAAGRFSVEFAEPGIRTLQFKHSSTSMVGSYNAVLHEDSSIDLSVILQRNQGSGGNDTWLIQRRYSKRPAVASSERVISTESMKFQPGTDSLWSFLNMTEPSVVTDRFDISGLHSYRQLRLGVRGSSLQQNQASRQRHDNYASRRRGIARVPRPFGDGKRRLQCWNFENSTYGARRTHRTHTENRKPGTARAGADPFSGWCPAEFKCDSTLP